MELREALEQISEIRLQMARTEVFRGYRSAPTAFSGLLAFVAAGYQAVALPQPLANLNGYLILWISAALLAMSVVGIEMLVRCLRSESSLVRERTWLAVSQFLPPIIAGGLLTLIVAVLAQDVAWMLPGLWSVLFSLGLFASYRLLPRATFWVAVYYLSAGLWCLCQPRQAFALSPYAMAITFGVGQLFAAAVLYWNLERDPHEER